MLALPTLDGQRNDSDREVPQYFHQARVGRERRAASARADHTQRLAAVESTRGRRAMPAHPYFSNRLHPIAVLLRICSRGLGLNGVLRSSRHKGRRHFQVIRTHHTTQGRRDHDASTLSHCPERHR